MKLERLWVVVLWLMVQTAPIDQRDKSTDEDSDW